MEMEDKKYDRILNILRKSNPGLTDTRDIEEKVLDKIRESGIKKQADLNLFDFLFGWVYIGWMRRALIVVSIFFVGLFIYQQSLILKRINLLENQTVVTGSQFVSRTSSSIEEELMLNRFSIRRLNTIPVTITKKQVDKLVNSYNELEHKYKDLIQLINDDPELKLMLEKKLTERNIKKLNL
jgi:hypothetical protein